MPYAANGPINAAPTFHRRWYRTGPVQVPPLKHVRAYGSDAFWDDVSTPPGVPGYERPTQGQLWPRFSFIRRG